MILMPCALKAPILGVMPASLARQYVDNQWREARLGAENPGASRRLFVDVSVIFRKDARTGIQRVVRSVLTHLLSDPPPGHEVVPIAATRTSGFRQVDLSGACPGFPPVVGQGMQASPVSGDTFLALDLAPSILPCHWDQLHRWKRIGVSVQAVVYDLLPVLHTEWFTERAVKHFMRWLKTLAIFADRLHCISRVVSADVEHWFKAQFNVSFCPQSLHVFPLGADIVVKQGDALDEEARAAVAFASRAPTALMVGTIEPRKGHAEVLQAFETLWTEGRTEQLLIVGAPGWKTDALQSQLQRHPEAGKKLLWISNASDGLLVSLYRVAQGVIVASAGEGLGLPILEAVHFRKPLLVRDLPVFREAAGDWATFFPEHNGLSGARLGKWFTHLRFRPPDGRIQAPNWDTSVNALLHNMGIPVVGGDAGRP